jgi:radical SAM protein with 4Fe4S-binding SPASM domain
VKENNFSLIEIEINHSCNLACSYCPNALHKRIETGEMSTELFTNLMQQLEEKDYQGLVSFHFYNEPLLCSKLDLFVEILKAHVPKARLQIYSNGQFLNFKRTMELIELGVDYFCITKHEQMKAGYVFDTTIEMLSEENKKKVTYHKFSQIELNNRGGLLPHLNKKEKNYSGFPCMIAQVFTVVTLKGNVLPCYEDFNQTEVMGNIGEKNIFEIWKSAPYVNFRKELKSKRSDSSSELCKKCDNFTIVSDDW